MKHSRINTYNMGDKNNKDNKPKDELEELLHKVANMTDEELKKEKKTVKKNFSKKNLNLIASYLNEYFDCFVLVGYDIEDNGITVQNINTQGEFDKLIHSLGRYIATGGSMGGLDDGEFDDINSL